MFYILLLSVFYKLSINQSTQIDRTKDPLYFGKKKNASLYRVRKLTIITTPPAHPRAKKREKEKK